MKKALAVAILSIFSGAANAQSSVTMMGYVGGGVRWVNGVKGGTNVSFDNNIIAGSKVGIRGSEDLGGNTRAIFELQSAFSSGTGALLLTESYMGLAGSFGQITLGRQLSAFEDMAIVLDPSYARGISLAIVPAAVYGANIFTLDTRYNNSVKYRNKVGGLTLSGSYSFGGVAGNTRAGSSYSTAALYQYQTLLAGVGYQKTYNADATQSAAVLEAGGAWQLGPARLYLSYSDFSVSGASVRTSRRHDKIPAGGIVYQMTPQFQITAAVYADMARNLSNVSGANGHKITTYAIAEYFLSKRTELYAEFDYNGFTGAYKTDPVNIVALNMRSGASSMTGVSVGIMTRF
ncbi:porin [Burkholderia cepacia]|uniref:porin n=1 Tax=Burkholderia cepacia TaxID=292 RepID=UPI000751A9D5|nr:porin [Burkholderia cepacia]KVW77456.1 porin [Burkholderia cepacia]KVX72126.1 porin [Burkholderia cepacia]